MTDPDDTPAVTPLEWCWCAAWQTCGNVGTPGVIADRVELCDQCYAADQRREHPARQPAAA